MAMNQQETFKWLVDENARLASRIEELTKERDAAREELGLIGDIAEAYDNVIEGNESAAVVMMSGFIRELKAELATAESRISELQQDDPELTFGQLRRANLARLPLFLNRKGELAHDKADGSDWSLCEWMCAVAGELGEAANVLKKVRRGDLVLTDARSGLADEYADVVIYLDILAYQTGVDLGDAVRKKWDEVSERIGVPLRLPAADALLSTTPSEELWQTLRMSPAVAGTSNQDTAAISERGERS